MRIADHGLVLRLDGSGEITIACGMILTAERLHSRRGFDLHVQGRLEPVRVRCRRGDCGEIERGLRSVGVRIVDVWGAIIASTLLDFEEELDREPHGVRQSSDDA